MIKHRVTAELGDLGSIERAIERLFKTLVDWEVLTTTPGKEHIQDPFSGDEDGQTRIGRVGFILCYQGSSIGCDPL